MNLSSWGKCGGTGLCLWGISLALISCAARDEKAPPAAPATPKPAISAASALPVLENKTGLEEVFNLSWPKGIEPLAIAVNPHAPPRACDELGTELAKVLDSRDYTAVSWTQGAEDIFPQLGLVWRMYAGKAHKLEIDAHPEARVIYDYLFSTEEKTEASLKRLSALLCWYRLDRAWLALSEQKNAQHLPAWGVCPQTKQSFLADKTQISCPVHGISLTIPGHNARPVLDEVMLQLCSGGFSPAKRHELDMLIFRDPIAAIKSGETVADIGCGVGAHTLAMSSAVGNNGLVYAVDINSDVLGFVEQAKKIFAIDNIATVRASDFDPALKPNSLDRAFMIDLYDSLVMNDIIKNGKVNTRTDRYFYKLSEALKPKSELIIIDKQATQNEWHLPASVVSGHWAKYGFREVKWYLMEIGGVPKQIVVLQKDTAVQVK
ncbi:MAG: methyltransferase domain-containing protein [bacterium]|nr:methyltransferase domain-containing protein [bacterium]